MIVLLASLTALAEEIPADETEAKPEITDEGPPPDTGTPDRVEFGGRVFIRDTLSAVDTAGTTTWSDDATIDSARAFLIYRPNERLRMDLEVDFAGGETELKDTFIRYEPGSGVKLTAGRFKRPISFLGLESSWSLPRIERGLLSELRIDGTQRLLFAGGRGDGVSASFELPGALRPELTLTVQESEIAEVQNLDATEMGQDAFARGEIEPVDDLHLAIAGGWVGAVVTMGVPDSYRHRPFGSIEAFYDGDAIRAWAEGFAGRNAHVYVPVGEDDVQVGRFVAARALIAPRFERVLGLRRIEPYAAVSWLDPSTLQDDDQVGEATGGVSLMISRHLRLQLEGGRRMAQGFAAPSGDATIVRVQLGAAFKSETEIE